MKTLIGLLVMVAASPAMAQHNGHTMPVPKEAPTPKPAPEPQAKPSPAPVTNTPAASRKPMPAKPEAASTSVSSPPPDPAGTRDHDAMDHSTMDHSAMSQSENSPELLDHSQMDHDTTDQSQMDHSAMGHDKMAKSIPEAPPPAAAGSGPARAADAIWGTEAMRGSREKLAHNQGGQTYLGFMADRFEYRARDGTDGYLWDIDAWYGGDIHKVWLESEGEGAFGEEIEDAQVQLLYGRAISPWFDLQAGVRQDFTGPARTYLDLGIQGLAPYLFEIETDLFLSNKGDLTATAEVELDQRITQRLIIQPRGEIALSAQDVPELGIGAGIDTIEAGLRLRYEFTREFAPYIGAEQEWKLGDSADFARAAGEDPSVTNYVIGVRFWF